MFLIIRSVVGVARETNLRDFEHITCLRNPLVGHELDWKVETTDKPERVAIVGGAVAGKKVTVLEMAERAGADLGSARATCVFGKLAKLGVEILASTAFAGLTHCTVGDAERPRRALDAIREGFLAGLED